MNHFKNYVLAVMLMMIALQSQAKDYAIVGSTQPLVVYNDVTAVFNDSIIVPGSNFTMFVPVGSLGVPVLGPGNVPPYTFSATTEDILGSLDDLLLCFDTTCTVSAMTMYTSGPTLFSGTPWVAHDIRVFGPGTYQFDTCLPDGSTTCTTGGNPSAAGTLVVGPGQLGAQVFFNYAINLNIDVLLLWQPNATFTRPTVYAGFSDAETRLYDLASRDVDGDGKAGYAMTDGPFPGHNASFSLFLDQPLAVPALPVLLVSQGLNAGAASGIISLSDGQVTVDAGLSTVGTPSYDWNVVSSPKYADNSDMYPASDAALVTASAGTSSQTFVFNPSGFSDGDTAIVSVRVTNVDNALSHGAKMTLTFGCLASSAAPGVDTDGDGIDDNDASELCGDTDGDGIINYLDPAGLGLTQVSIDLPARSFATSSTGVLGLGSLAKLVADSNGKVGTGIGVSLVNIGTTDDAVIQSCVGGCFDFTVTGGTLAGAGTSASVVIPLTTAVPARAVYKKFSGGAWSEFDATASLDRVDSAASVASVCPAPGDAAYSNGLAAGDDCLQISIEDNGPNDADLASGKIADPGGVAEKAASTTSGAPTTKVDGGVFGCSASATPVKVTDSGELYLLLGFVIWLGLYRTRVVKENI